MELDFNVPDAEGRKRVLTERLPKSPTRGDLQRAADYLLFVGDARQTKAEREEEYPIVTANRMVTLGKREVSCETLAAEDSSADEAMASVGGGDGVSAMPLDRKWSREPGDEDLPYMRDNLESVESLKRQMARATGRRRFELKKQIISKYQEQHLIRESSKCRPQPVSRVASTCPRPSVGGDVRLNSRTLLPESDSPVSLYDPRCVAAMLSDYVGLVEAVGDDVTSDVYWLLWDLQDAVTATYRDRPDMMALVSMRLAKMPLPEVVARMASMGYEGWSEQRVSAAWCHRVPRDVAEHCCREWLVRNYVDPLAGKWKVCTRCHRRLLAHPLWFNRNTSSVGYYSICRDCRSKAGREKRLMDGEADDVD